VLSRDDDGCQIELLDGANKGRERLHLERRCRLSSMITRINTEVLIVGGGSVGLTLAIDLAQRGIEVTVAETRAGGELPSVKCNHVAARTMEIFRRLGLVRAVREAGLPAEYPNDVAFRTTATGLELSRIPIQCRAERYTAKGPDTWWPTPEPPHRINQIYLEPVLFAHAASTPQLRILNRTRVVDFAQSETGVRATAEDLDTGGVIEIFAAYLIGCDGAHSDVRHVMGAKFSGDAVVMQTQSTYIRAPQLLGMIPRPAWLSVSLNPRCSGYLFAIDGRERWLVHNWRPPDEDLATLDRDRCIRQILGVEPSFKFEILGQEDWTGRRMIADRFRDRRVFLCGDAAHIWVPCAGYGMNAGIADAMNLSWKLAGVIKGWAQPAILDTYEVERQPVTEQVSRYAMNTSFARQSLNSTLPDNLEEPGPEGDALRARIGRDAYELNVGQFCCGGLNFGYFYKDSPIIAYDAEEPPGYTLYDFSQSTVPGCRSPHLWLGDGRSLYDALGPEFTILRFDRAVEIGDLVAAAAQRGVPMLVLDVDAAESASLYPQKLLLSRPDQHVAWRGDEPPEDSMGLIDRVRGAFPRS
jgi:2-polyprenyl-6-methoxyphenol hydroxylase-like FAD-dependent oxidoreductase